MAKDHGGKGKKESADGAAGPSNCKFDGCKKSQEKFGFCKEHYEWYMAGVIKGDGSKPVDYEQKLSLHHWRSQRKVA